MKNAIQIHSHSRVKQYSVGIIAAACLISLLPTEALARCRSHDLICKTKEQLNRARDAARRAADNARHEFEAAARRTADETKRLADAAKATEEAAARETQRLKDIADAEAEATARRVEEETRRQADAAKEMGEAAARETQRLKDLAEAEIKKLLEQAMQEALNVAFGQLRAVGLDVLANTNKFTDPELWLREITLLVMKDLAGDKVAQQGNESVSYIRDQLGNFSETTPFGSGPVGRQLQAEVEKTYKKALLNITPVGEKALDYLNPLKNQILPKDEDFNIAKAMYAYDIPDFMRLSYATDFAVTPLEATADFDKRSPYVLKGNVQTSFPLLWGNDTGATTIFVNAVNNQKFNFVVSAGAAWQSKSLKGDEIIDRKHAFADAFKFDVSCSTQNIGMCQLKKITYESKIEFKRKSATSVVKDLEKAMSSTIIALDMMDKLSLIDNNAKQSLVSVLRKLESTIKQPVEFVDRFEDIVYIPADADANALNRQTDIKAIAYIFSAIRALPDLTRKFEGKTSKQAISLTQLQSGDLGLVREWHNADAVNNTFRPGFKFIGGNNPLPDTIGLKIGKKIATEAAVKVSSLVSDSSVGASMNVSTSSVIGAFLPLKTAVMDNYDMIKQRITNSGMTNELQNVMSNAKGSFEDRIGLASSKQWDKPAELTELESTLQMRDNLNLATHTSISGN